MLDPNLEQLFAMLIPGCAELNNTSDTETDTDSEVAMFLAPLSPITAICKPPTRKPKPKPEPSPDGGTPATPGEIEKLLRCVCLCETCDCGKTTPCTACAPGGTYGSYPDVNGPATGPFAIHEPFWRDGSYEGTKPAGTYKDCEGYDYSLGVVRGYWKRWGSEYSVECLARLHNGGPKGCSNKYPGGSTATDAYWKDKIKPCMDKQTPPPALPSIP